MRTVTTKKLKCISEATANSFEDKVNAVLSSVNDPEIKIDGNRPFTAYIFYEEEKVIPETVKDEFELRGELYTCNDCPYYEPSTDGRIKYTACRYSTFRVGANTSACELFYKRLAKGEL